MYLLYTQCTVTCTSERILKICLIPRDQEMVNVFEVSASVLFWTLALTSSTADGRPELLAVVFGLDKPWPAYGEAGDELNSANMVQEQPTPNPPSPDNAAKMARFIVHYSCKLHK